jgi:hypothetical protein
MGGAVICKGLVSHFASEDFGEELGLTAQQLVHSSCWWHHLALKTAKEVWWLMPVIPAAGEAAIRRIVF